MPGEPVAAFMNPARAHSIADLRRMARRRLPRILFDWVDGGTDDEHCLRRNERQFDPYRLIPRYLMHVDKIDTRVELFGQTHAQLFGIGPTGYAGLLRPDADVMLARAAASAGIPFVLSGNSTDSIERVTEASDGQVWYQLYAAKEPAITADLVRRAHAVGVKTLVYTVDCPIEANRERDMRNGFDLPLRITPRLLADVLSHPVWLFSYLTTGGLPRMENWAAYAEPGADAIAVAKVMKSHYFAPQTWEDMKRLRALWPGTLVVKGINDPRDAQLAVEAGADGIVISNHGGRQLDLAPTAAEMLPHIRAVTPSNVKIMLDGGFRRGSDIVMAYCLGADFVFTGRATLFGAIAGGEAGAMRAVTILSEETRRVMGQMGCVSAEDLDASRVMVERSPGELAPVLVPPKLPAEGEARRRPTVVRAEPLERSVGA
jgi:(S)-mandelate dehydrogenase